MNEQSLISILNRIIDKDNERNILTIDEHAAVQSAINILEESYDSRITLCLKEIKSINDSEIQHGHKLEDNNELSNNRIDELVNEILLK